MLSESRMPLDQAVLWRISFSKIEKALISHADGTANRKRSKKTFRKHFMKIFKSFLAFELDEALRLAKITEDHRTICSYHFKTLSLNMLNTTEYKDASNWKYAHLQDNLRSALSYLYNCVDKKQLYHHFIPNVNILEHISHAEQGIIKNQIKLALAE